MQKQFSVVAYRRTQGVRTTEDTEKKTETKNRHAGHRPPSCADLPPAGFRLRVERLSVWFPLLLG